MSFRIAHLSDLHFGRALPAVANALLVDLQNQKPDRVIISGDLTQRARRQEFIDAAQFIQTIGLPVLVIPGNHDIPLYNPAKRLFNPLKAYQKYISADLTAVYADDQVAIMALDTTCRYRWKSGVMTVAQMRQMQSFFGKHQSAHKILVTHHPLLAETPHAQKHIHAVDIKALLHSCNIDILLSGHLHQSRAKEVVADPLNPHKNYLMVYAGTAISSRCRTEANAYNLLHFEGQKLRIEVRSCQNQQFVSSQESVFTKKALYWYKA